MKKTAIYFILFLIGVSFLFSITACGKKEKNQTDLAVGNWIQYRNRAYILLITNPKGEWNSSVRIADVTGKIVKSKGHAKGTWYIENSQMIFTVSESEIEEIWEKNSTTFFDIVELIDTVMQLKDAAGRIVIWKKTNVKKAVTADADLSPIVSMGPVVVNLNKNRSNDKDRYLCLDLNLVLNELMPDQEIPLIHPKVRNAAIIFLSSLVFNDVKDFEKLEKQTAKLVDVLNPYMEGFINEITIEHVIIATEVEKAEEFIIEHTLIEGPAPDAGEEEEKPKLKSD